MSIKKLTSLDSRSQPQQRIIAYIDGFNLYYGIKALKHPRLKWLDINKLIESILPYCHPNAKIEKIKYFTAFIKGDYGKIQRQRKYLKAIKLSPAVEIIEGKYMLTPVLCKSCGKKYKSPKEKQTDVNIACHILGDLYDDNFDICLVISADSDLLEPIKRVMKNKEKTVIVWFPPKRNCHDIKNNGVKYYKLFESTIQKSMLPLNIDTEGQLISIPEEWNL